MNIFEANTVAAPPTRETHFTESTVEIRSAEGKRPSLRGYAALYDKRSVNMGWGDWEFYETIAPGAFDGRLKDDVAALFNHDPNQILGRSRGGTGTLSLGTDERGLWYELEIPDTRAGADLIVSVRRGDVSQSSFAFTLNPDGFKWEEETKDGKTITKRTIKQIAQLHDVSPVTFAAYPDTSVALRSLAQFRADRHPAIPAKDFSDPRETYLRIITRA